MVIRPAPLDCSLVLGVTAFLVLLQCCSFDSLPRHIPLALQVSAYRNGRGLPMNRLMARIFSEYPTLSTIKGTNCPLQIRCGWTLVVLGLFPACLLLSSSGCALQRGRTSDDVVAARQLSLQGIDARQRGHLHQAESLLSRAVEMCPLDENIRSHFAETLWDSGQREQAVANMEEAVRLSGGNIDLMVRLGEMYLAQGDLDRAADQANRAIRANPSLAAAWALRGNVLRLQNRDQESLAAYHRALSYQEHYPSVQLAIGEIYHRQGRYNRELATLRSLADSYAPGETPYLVLYRQGLALKQLQRYQAAAELLARAAKRGLPSPELLYHLAESQWLAGDPANARLTLRSAVDQSRTTPEGQRVATALQSLDRQFSGTTWR